MTLGRVDILNITPDRPGVGRLRPLGSALVAVARVRVLLTTSGLDAAVRYAHRERGPSVAESLHHERVVAWSVGAVARLVPGASCLTQALAGQCLLARRGLGSRVIIGVRPAKDGALLAHAWLVRGTRVLLGGADSLAQHRTIREIVLYTDRGGTHDPLPEPAGQGDGAW